MNSENTGTPAPTEIKTATNGNAGVCGDKAPWTAPILSRLDGKETQAITPPGQNPGSPKDYSQELFAGS